jgi:hypothetical protein
VISRPRAGSNCMSGGLIGLILFLSWSSVFPVRHLRSAGSFGRWPSIGAGSMHLIMNARRN